MTTNNDIQDWIKTVEAASDRAAQKVFGSNSKSSGKSQGKVASLKSVSQLREHDAALTEAQDLLSQWMDEKVQLHDEGDEDLEDDLYQRRTVQSDVKREWDHLLQNNYEEQGLVKPRPTINDDDPYAFLAEQDEDTAVESIVQHMLSKKFVKDNITNDLGFEDFNKPDPRTKMELRHKQVKENRKKREQELNKKKKEQQAKKDAHHKAKQIVLQEEKNKLAKAKKEEMEIRKEMARIRKDMQEERRQFEEQRSRQRKNQEETLNKATVLVDQEEEKTRQEKESRDRAEEERRRKIMMKLGQIETRKEAANLKSLQRHFSAWYNIVLQRRLQIGRAKAIHDWKLLLQAWNAWKAYIRTRRMDRETKQHEISVIQTHRKAQAAETHYRSWLLRKYFVAWQLWIKMELERKEMEQAQEKTRNKMAALLEAAAKGKLSEGNNTDRSEQAVKATNLEVDALFENNQRRPLTSRSDVSTIAESTSGKRPLEQNRIPTEAWQITKKHLQLTTDEIAGLGGGDGKGEHHSDQKIRNRFGTQPWMNRKYIPNSFENRHNAQQRILEEQQRQLKEQQQLIEELQFNQRKQVLEQQGSTQRQLAERITSPQGPNNSKTTTHQSKQQNNKVNKGDYQEIKAGDTNSNTSELLTQRSEISEQSEVTARSEVTAKSEVTPRSEVTSTSSTATNKSSNTKYLKVLKNMESRAAERARLKAEREEKRRIAEEENLKRLKAEEEMLLQRDADEKKARIAAHREKKRLEKEKEIQKQQREQQMKELAKKADAHYLRATLKFRCLGPFQKLVEMARRNKNKAVQHYNNALKRQALLTWQSNVKDIIHQKEAMADQMYKYFLIRHFFSNWRNFKHHTTIMEGRARRIHERNTKCKVFQAWHEYTQVERDRAVENTQLATDHYTRFLLKKAFHAIKDYPLTRKKEIEREKRRAEMREKVAALIPDYEAAEIRKSSTDFS